jgi:CTP synthase
VQVIPHITDEIKRRITLLATQHEYDIVITEIGGTIGDIESLPYVEAIRQLQWENGKENCLVVHLTLIPYLKAAKELKTKPTQHSVKLMNENGLSPDIIVCRTEEPINGDIKRKIALFCNVTTEAVIEAADAETIYDVPLHMMQESLDVICLEKMKMSLRHEPDLKRWKEFLHKLKHPTSTVTIGLVGKYVELQDAYKSILEAFVHAGAVNECKVEVRNIHSENLNKDNVKSSLSGLDGILVAPGFGNRGVEGKIEAIQYAREHHIPFFGICLGMQCCVIEFARNVLGYSGANSTEMDVHTAYPVIDIMENQKNIIQMGGTMRLGAYDCEIETGSKAYEIYGKQYIKERHRHRWEFNNTFLEQFESHGMKAVGKNPETGLVEIVELSNHPFFIGSQFHPELKSTVEKSASAFCCVYQSGYGTADGKKK